jgi:hypothetical protein
VTRELGVFNYLAKLEWYKMSKKIVGKITQKAAVVVAISLAIVLICAQTSIAFKETATSNEDGFQRGVKDANRDLQGLNGHGFDDSCPKGHMATFCDGYKQGYTERYYDTNENDS